jgi:dTDP-4-dehydrorhamnose reductase
MAKVLVTGASGLLGANLIFDGRGRHDFVGVYHQHAMEIDGAVLISADLSREGVARKLMRTHEPAWVVHTAAATNMEACEVDPGMAFRLNCDMTRFVAEASWSIGAGLIHISTDAVFDGRRGNYVETDEVNPLSVYARSKYEAEQAVATAHPEAAIVRTNIFGWNMQPKQSLAEMFLHHLEKGERCHGFTDVSVTTILVNDLVELLLKMIEAGLSGMYHVGGGECLSKYDFGLRLADTFGLDGTLIEPITVAQMNFKAKRGNHLCMKGDKIEAALGVELPDISGGLRRFRELRANGHAERLKMHSRR